MKKKKITFPNGLECYYHSSKEETEYIFTEIFTEQQYLAKGLIIRQGDCIFDVGANIGLFSLFIKRIQKDVKIYAFEPIEPTFATLQENIRLHYLDNMFLFNYGLSSENNHEQLFTYYLDMAGNSTSKPGEKLVDRDDSIIAEDANSVEDLFAGFFTKQQQVKCQMRTLSSVIEELGINSIDLLKVDVEGEEYEVFKGIEDKDWPKISQIVAEIHDRKGRLETITNMLKHYGFEIQLQKRELLPAKFVDTFNLHAIRKKF